MKQSVRFGKRSDLLLKLLDKYDEVEDVGEKIRVILVCTVGTLTVLSKE